MLITSRSPLVMGRRQADNNHNKLKLIAKYQITQINMGGDR